MASTDTNANHTSNYQNISAANDARVHAGHNYYFGASQNEKETQCHQALYTSDYQQHKDRNPQRVSGTCGWVTRHPHYKQWKNSPSSCLLWISADPGCGKSVLAKYMVDEEIGSTQSRTTCHFFFKDDNEDQKSASKAVSSLLHQLFKTKPSLIHHAMHRYKDVGDKISDGFEYLFDILLEASRDSEAGEIVCVLDALDECRNPDRMILVNRLSNFHNDCMNKRNTHGSIKLLITSRPYENIEQGFRNVMSMFPTIRVSGESNQESLTISKEIDIVIKDRTKELATRWNLGIFITMKLENALLKPNQRTYLWVQLIFETINVSYLTEDNVGRLIATIPTSLEDVYEHILSKADTSHTPYWSTRDLFHVILASRRPLTLQELYVAVNMMPHAEVPKDIGHTDEQSFMKEIRYRCGLFVTVFNSRVFLIHQTAREFLLFRKTHFDHGLTHWGHSFSTKDSEAAIANSCAAYISSVNEKETVLVGILVNQMFTTNKLLLQSVYEQKESIQRSICKISRNLREKYVFLDYSLRHWPSHMRACDMNDTRISEKTIMDLCNHESVLWLLSDIVEEGLGYKRNATPWSKLMIASYFEIPVVLDLMLQQKQSGPRQEDLDLSLMCACVHGHWHAANSLLIAKADPRCLFVRSYRGEDNRICQGWLRKRWRVRECLSNFYPDVVGNAVYIATQRDHPKLLSMLLDAAPSTNLDIGLTALSTAASLGHENIVRLLISRGTDVIHLRHAFHYVLTEDIEILLVQAGIDLDVSKDYCPWITPLHRASWSGHERTVELLLQRGANVNAANDSGYTAFIEASRTGHKGIVKLLLQNGANIDAVDECSNTALLQALQIGHEEIVEFLLQSGANVNIAGQYGNTPLLQALKKEDVGIVRLLLQAGANVNAANVLGNTALIEASQNGNERIVRLLIQAGANVDAADALSNTALIHASMGRGKEGIVKLLLQAGANTNEANVLGNTALIATSQNGNERIVRLLLQAGADINCQNQDGRTALDLALKWGRSRIAELLRSHGTVV